MLVDPRAPEVPRYIGKTSQGLSRRLVGHLFEAKSGTRNHKANWIRSLVAEGITPEITPLVVARSEDELNGLECAWIARVRELGLPLCNQTDGGEGAAGNYGRKNTPETIAKMKAAARGRRIPVETMKKAWLANTGIRQTPERIAARVRANTGRKHTPEQRAGMKAAAARPEEKRRKSAQMKTLWSDADYRTRRAASMQIALARPEEKARRTAATKSSWQNPEIRARRIAGLKAAGVRRRAA